MLLQHLFENAMMPPKAVAIMAARFFHDMHFGMEKILDSLIEAYGNELNFDVEDHPNMRLMVTWRKAASKPPKAELRTLLLTTAKKYELQGFKPTIKYEPESQWDFWIEINFEESLGLDEDALEAGEAEMKKIGLTDAKTLTINF